MPDLAEAVDSGEMAVKARCYHNGPGRRHPREHYLDSPRSRAQAIPEALRPTNSGPLPLGQPQRGRSALPATVAFAL